MIHRQGQRMRSLLGGWGEKWAKVSEGLETGGAELEAVLTKVKP